MIGEEDLSLEFRSALKAARSVEAMFLASTHSWRRGVKSCSVESECSSAQR